MSANTAIHMVALPNSASPMNTTDAEVRRDVLPQNRMGSLRQANGFRDTAQIVVHHGDVSGFHRRVGAGPAHRETNVILSQRGASLMPSPVMARCAVLPLHLLNRLELVFRQKLPRASLIPARLATVLAVAALSPVSMTV